MRWAYYVIKKKKKKSNMKIEFGYCTVDLVHVKFCRIVRLNECLVSTLVLKINEITEPLKTINQTKITKAK